MAAERSPFIEFPPKTDVNPDVGLAVCLRPLGMQTSALGGLKRPGSSWNPRTAWNPRLGIRLGWCC
jgi:hypothetical protein